MKPSSESTLDKDWAGQGPGESNKASGDHSAPRFTVLDAHGDDAPTHSSKPLERMVEPLRLFRDRLRTAASFAQKHPITSGACLGALLALSVVYLATQFFKSPDPALIEVSSATSALTTSVDRNNQRLSGLEADVAQSINLATQNAESIANYDRQLQGFITRLDSVEASSQSQDSVGSPVFGVAAAQLLSKIAAGESFAPEWVNIYSLTEAGSQIRQSLDRLMPMAQSGTQTPRQLLATLMAYRERRFFPESSLGRFWVDTLSTVQYKLGVPVGRPTSEEIALQHVDQAIGYLRAQDTARAEYIISTLESPFAEELGPWLNSIRRYQVALDVARSISETAEKELRQRLQ